MFVFKIIGSKQITDTIIYTKYVYKVGRSKIRIEASSKELVDLILKRILVVVRDERCENHLGLKGKGFFSMYIREELVIPNFHLN